VSQNLHDLIFAHNYSEQPQLALQEGFKELDRHWLEMAQLNGWDDGSTGVCCLLVERVLYVANAGDSRAVLCSKGGRAVDMSADHKPAREDEKQRIEKLGGRIIHYGTWRVQGVLAVTRSYGNSTDIMRRNHFDMRSLSHRRLCSCPVRSVSATAS